MKKTFGFFLIVLFFAVVIYVSRNDESHEANLSSLAPAGDPQQQAVIDEITKIVIGTASRNEIIPNVQKITEIASQSANAKMPGVQTLAGIVRLVPELEGIIYRFRKIVEPSDWLHVMALYNLRSLNYNSYTYGTHIQALIDFMEKPTTSSDKPEFETVSDAQVFMITKLARPLETLLEGAKQMEQLPNSSFVFKLDRTLFVGQDPKMGIRFIDSDQAHKTFIKPFHYTNMFLLQRLVGSLYYVAALNLDGVAEVTGRMIKATELNYAKDFIRPEGSTAKGITPIMMYGAIQNVPGYLDFHELKISDQEVLSPASMLQKSYQYAQLSAEYQLAAYVCGIRAMLGDSNEYTHAACSDGQNILDRAKSAHSSDAEDYLFNVNQMLTGYKQKYATLVDRNRVLHTKGPSVITSELKGTSVKINVQALFDPNHSPRSLMPTGYEPVEPGTPYKGILAWNYNYGKPKIYPDATFGGFLPNATNANLYQELSSIVYTDSIAPFSLFLPTPTPLQSMLSVNDIVSSN